MLVDAFDGIFARKYGLERNFGRYLDSFVDVLDYLVAPAIFLYCWGFTGILNSTILVFFIICGIIRLSVFNQVGNLKEANNDKLSYWGMPVFWSIFILAAAYLLALLISKPFVLAFLAVVIVIYSILMIYNGRFYKFQDTRLILILVIGGIVLFALLGYGSKSAFNSFWTLVGSALFLTLPIIVGGILHMVFVAKHWLDFLAIPVQNRLFGANKTWRGFIVMPVVTIPGVWLTQLLEPLWRDWLLVSLQDISILRIGLALGLAYVLFELPNSYIKRRLGAAPGKIPRQCHYCFVLLDQLDSAVGFAFVYFLFLDIPETVLLTQIAIFPLVAITIKSGLFLLKLKKKSPLY
nr:MAG: CDP-diacylglycerol---serine O-phosphatidyltransferase [Candidatus Kentron sp. H]VFJ92331.1 MAG: CDP-diacylglycerol---serine O-phosphatidyltransferase [Candidatus Kentron sp. H]